MKRFLVFVVGLAVLVGGAGYFVAETVILPKQEEVWRGLLKDLPYGLSGDFEDVNFERAGLRLSIGGATLTDGVDTIAIDEVVAENTIPTAIGNLVRFVMGQEEERYDIVRFVGLKPQSAGQNLDVNIGEVRLLDVAIGIDNNLPSTIKTLTGAINLEDAFKARSFDGLEILDIDASAEGVRVRLDWLKVHEIAKTSVGLIDIEGFIATQGVSELAGLESFKVTNLNIAPYMEPGKVLAIVDQSGSVDISEFNFFHFADRFEVVGLRGGMPGLARVSIKRAMYAEERTEIVPNIGIVPTRTFSEFRDYHVSFPGLAMLDPSAAQFMEATGIAEILMNAESDSDWDLETGVNKNSGWLDISELIKQTLSLEMGNVFPRDIVKMISFGATLPEPTSVPDTGEVIDQAMDFYGAMTIIDFDWLIENKSLVERLLKYGEVATGMPEADLKAAIDMQLAMVQADQSTPASLKEDIGALREFVANPGSLRISLDPPQPISIDEIMELPNPAEAIRRTGFSIRANETTDVASDEAASEAS